MGRRGLIFAITIFLSSCYRPDDHVGLTLSHICRDPNINGNCNKAESTCGIKIEDFVTKSDVGGVTYVYIRNSKELIGRHARNSRLVDIHAYLESRKDLSAFDIEYYPAEDELGISEYIEIEDFLSCGNVKFTLYIYQDGSKVVRIVLSTIPFF